MAILNLGIHVPYRGIFKVPRETFQAIKVGGVGGSDNLQPF